MPMFFNVSIALRLLLILSPHSNNAPPKPVPI
nr:MAG TPA: hypothetical protein [Caudoviricetes sp.]